MLHFSLPALHKPMFFKHQTEGFGLASLMSMGTGTGIWKEGYEEHSHTMQKMVLSQKPC